MRYITVTFVPRAEGWYAFMGYKETRGARRGRPRDLTVYKTFFESTAGVTEQDLAHALSDALARLSRPSG